MNDEAAESLSELREYRIAHDHLMGEVRTELAGVRAELDAGFRRMNEQLAVLHEMAEALERQVTDMSDRLSRRRKLG